MHNRRRTPLTAATIVAGVAAALLATSATSARPSAPQESTVETTVESTVETTVAPSGSSAPAATLPPATPVTLKGDCPDTVVIQTDWMPEAEHGFLYEMVGANPEIDKAKGYVTGTLIDGTGADTGVKLQIRSGGAPQQYQPVSQIMYTDESILLGFVYTDEAIQFSTKFPTVAIESGMEKNPQIIMWDPATYPDVKGIADLGKTDAVVRYFDGAAYMDYLTSTGLLKKSQVSGTYQGDPALWLADEGKAAQQGFASAEPYKYEHEIDGWKKPVKYEYINDVGWRNYGESIATKPENITKYSACFTKLVPLIQRASVTYMQNPKRTNDMILAAVDAFGKDFGWSYNQGVADYAVETMRKDGLLANGADGVMGSFDEARVADLIDKATPVYEAQKSDPKKDLKPADIVTNQFLDKSIKL